MAAAVSRSENRPSKPPQLSPAVELRTAKTRGAGKLQRAEIGEGKPPIGTDYICHERAFCGKVGEPLVVIRMQPLGCHQSDSLPRAVAPEDASLPHSAEHASAQQSFNLLLTLIQNN